ncbi:MAG: hypothetical protein LBR65_04180 [Culturomica sp.]|jgi:hypothetical protein|nr:hypothetical protein [Culturomica sp.]
MNISNFKEMKKNVFNIIAVLAVAALVAFNMQVNTVNRELPDISLVNAKAFASDELTTYTTESTTTDSITTDSIATTTETTTVDSTTTTTTETTTTPTGSTDDWGLGDAILNILQGQGATKDEEEMRETCPIWESSGGSGSVSGGNGTIGGAASGSGSSSQANPSNRTDIRCKYGSQNCSTVSC